MTHKPVNPATVRRSDLVLSVALPLAVIGLGVALSVGAEGIGAFVDLCLAPFR
ncbi:MAG TPA: hypothetical protein VMP03_04390 [Methylomirabilota bacterium]|nr:hypothetical protein [Methylomirabilota bacterium]